MHTRLLLPILLLTFVPLAAWAQEGKISGTVVDRETGEPLPGATVVIEGTTRGAATNIDGEYVILDVAPGVYALRASYVGYSSQVVQEVQVSSGFTSLVEFQLAPGVELEEVVVLGEQLIRQDEVSTTTVIRGEEIQALPIDNFQDAMTLTAGIVESQAGDDQGIHIRGGRTGEVAYIVDGVFVEDPLSGSVGGFDVARQAIDELQVLSGGFSAEYGKAMSGVILINTPTGSNEFHGSLYLKTDGVSMEGLGSGGPDFDYTRPNSNDWGTRVGEISLSGPIIGDRVTFFANAARRDTDTYLSEFDGPERPAVLPWTELVGHEFMRTLNNSFVDANGQPVEVDVSDLGLEEGDVITEEHINLLREQGVDVERLGKAAISDYKQHHQMGLYNDRTSLLANLGIKVSRDIDTRFSYKLTRREYRGYDHDWKFLPGYAGRNRRYVDMFGAGLTHRLSANVFYELQASYTNNRYWYFLYDEQLDADDPFRFARLFPPFAVEGAFNTEGLSDAEGGSNYDFYGFSEAEIFVDYPFLMTGDLDRPFQLSRSLDLDGDGNLDVYRGDRLSEDLIAQIRSMFDSLSDDELSARGLTRGFIPILSPPTDNFYLERKINDFQIKGSISAQVNARNFVKFGVDYRQLDLRNYNVFANDDWDPSTDPADPNTKTRDPWDEEYVDVSPFELAVFVTDKIEFSNLVAHVGLRLDAFDPDMATFANYGRGGVLKRPNSPNDAQPEVVESDVRWNLSPRLGIAFPLTDRARVSFNYGHFLQYPELNRLYESYRTATWVPGTGYVPLEFAGFDLGFEPFLGNPNINPERTIFYQFDAEFLVGPTFKLGASLFYKDIYDYVAVRRILDGNSGASVWIMDNFDYANARGFEIRAEKRLEQYVGFTASYTFSRAKGNADDFAGAYDDWYLNSVYGTIPPKGDQPLDWDQPHTFNLTVNSRYKDLALNLVGRFGSGLPYTPTSSRGRPLGPKNSARRPWTGVIDARMVYTFNLARATFQPFVEVTNLLDRENILDVYDDTGSPDFTLDPGWQFEAAQIPYFYGPPRHFEFGIELSF